MAKRARSEPSDPALPGNNLGEVEELGAWLERLGASEFEAVIREQGATTVQQVLDSGINEGHLAGA